MLFYLLQQTYSSCRIVESIRCKFISLKYSRSGDAKTNGNFIANPLLAVINILISTRSEIQQYCSVPPSITTRERLNAHHCTAQKEKKKIRKENTPIPPRNPARFVRLAGKATNQKQSVAEATYAAPETAEQSRSERSQQKVT